jgi:hypothetical protein
MTDEPREENQPEDEDVEAHSPLGDAHSPLGAPLGDLSRGPEDEDVEAHSPLGEAHSPLGEAHRSDDDEDVEAHSAPLGAPLNEPPAL